MNAAPITEHVRLVKGTGMLIIVYTTVVFLVVTIQLTVSLDLVRIEKKNMTDLAHNHSVSTCAAKRNYALPDEIYLVVCKTGGVEVRKFIRGQPTEIGVAVSLRQWNYLKRLITYVDNSLHPFRT